MIGQTISHYRIVEKLGEGGMGIVYIAEDTVLGRRVAIKTLTAARKDEHFRGRFLREARSISKLSHPHIATIYDYGETDDGEPYIVMELIKGKTLGHFMVREALTIARVIEIVEQVAEALAEAHRNGIVHRDIKPSNIVINERGDVKVLDFGLAKEVSANPANSDTGGPLNTQTLEGVVVGTPLYLSPEQALGIEVDARSDLFSLGSVLYECLAGKAAFAGASPVEICARVIREDPPPPSRLNGNVPRELDRITLKGLAKKPDARYQTAVDMISDLRTAHANLEKQDSDQTVTRLLTSVSSTQPNSALATLSDLFRRPRLSIGYSAAALLLVGTFAIGVWYLTRAKPHAPTAEAQRLYDSGTNALRAGLFFQASKALELAVRSDDQFALAHARLAEAWLELDYTDKAKDEMLRVSELTPDRSVFTPVDALYLDAVTASVRRDFARAIQAYSEIARRQPDQPQVYVDLGRAYEKNNESEKAIEGFIRATKQDQQNPTAFLRMGILYGRQHNLAGANTAFDKAEEIYQSLGNVEGRTEVAFQRGVLLNDIAGKVEEARAQLEQARDMAKVVDSQYQRIRILFQLSSVSFKEGKTDQAQQYAREAVELAQTNQMESLIARGYLDLGNTYFVRGDYSEAERFFQQALEFAQRFSGRQNEARARLSLASLYVQRGEADRGLSFDAQALAFYQSGGYRTETSQALLLRGRAFKQKGDYQAALQSFQEQLKLAEQTGDQAQIAYSHGSIGNLLFDQEAFVEARPHLDKSYELYKSMGNQLYQGYALMNLGATLWWLGHDDDARKVIGDALNIAKQKGGSYTGLQAAINLLEAQIALSERRFPEAEAKSRQALDLAGAEDRFVAVEGKYLLGLSQAVAGRGPAGQALCQEASDAAAPLGDPLLLAKSELALAEAALAAGDAKRAIESSLKSQKFFAGAGLPELNWRAWIIAGLASQKAGDRNNAQLYLRSASDGLSSLQEKWGEEVFKSYAARPDIQLYRRQLDQSSAARR